MLQFLYTLDGCLGFMAVIQPVFSCDVCGKLINDQLRAGVLLPYPKDNNCVSPQIDGEHNTLMKPLIVCDIRKGSRCGDSASQSLNGEYFWDDLPSFTRALLFNTVSGFRPTVESAKTKGAINKRCETTRGKNLIMLL